MTNAILNGIAASSGLVKAKACVVLTRDDFSKFSAGSVLVTKVTDPSMIGVINKASAIVCDIGGITSHPSIIARELGIPCVVATKTATQDINDGDLLEVNGSTGQVMMLSGS